jgi:thiosulfate/3-mercaptopyruvate sulfurtransferase
LDVKDIFIDAEAVLKGIDSGSLVIVDIRSFSKYVRAHIPKALWLYFWDFTEHERGMPSKPKDPQEIARILGKNGIAREDRVVIAYDRMSIGLASYTYWYLEYMGQEEIYLLKGGIEEWESRGFPLEKGVVKPQTKEYKPRIRGSIRSTLDEVTKIAGGKEEALLLDIRTYEEYIGSLQTTPKPGRIPRALWIHPNIFIQILNGDKKALERIASIVEKARDKKIITYCATGERASMAWLVLNKILGLENVKLYPESFYEYSSKKELEIEFGEPQAN